MRDPLGRSRRWLGALLARALAGGLRWAVRLTGPGEPAPAAVAGGPESDIPEPDLPLGPAPDERRVARWISFVLILSALAGVGLLAVYALGGQVQIEGALLGLALGGIGIGLVLWGKYLFPHEIVTEEREPHPSTAPERLAAEASLGRVEEGVPRRTFLFRLLLAAAAALGLAAIFPIRSLGPGPGRSLFRTSWRRGTLLVDEGGNPVRVGDLPEGGVLTVFPDGHTDAEDSQAVLVKVDPELLRFPDDRGAWVPEGNICYSKICTHAGCPVGLYSADTHQLLCPCHQSAFDVIEGARPIFGPASRPLPQLPLEVDGEGFLRAAGDFPEPVGPGFWNREAGR